MRDETRERFEDVAQDAIEAAGCVPCESIEEFKEGLAILLSMIKERLRELDGC